MRWRTAAAAVLSLAAMAAASAQEVPGRRTLPSAPFPGGIVLTETSGVPAVPIMHAFPAVRYSGPSQKARLRIGAGAFLMPVARAGWREVRTHRGDMPGLVRGLTGQRFMTEAGPACLAAAAVAGTVLITETDGAVIDFRSRKIVWRF